MPRRREARRTTHDARHMSHDATARPYAALPAGTAHCARCAAVVDVSRADYSASGEMVCPRCASVQDIEATESRAVAGMKALAVGNIATGVLAWLLNPLFLFSIAAVVAAVVVVKAVNGAWYRSRMSVGARLWTSLVALFGAAVGLVPARGLFLLMYYMVVGG